MLSQFIFFIYNYNCDYNDTNLLETALKFMKNQSEYYDEFINKYVKSDKYKNSLIIDYDSFINDPKQYIKKIIEYLNLHENKDIELDEVFDYIINNFEKIEYKNTLSYEFYNKIKTQLK